MNNNNNSTVDNNLPATTIIDNYITTILADIKSSIHKNLFPLINQINETNSKYNIISTLMKEMPEFKQILYENNELKNQLNQLNQEEEKNNLHKESIKLHISASDIDDKTCVVVSQNDVTYKIKQIYDKNNINATDSKTNIQVNKINYSSEEEEVEEEEEEKEEVE